MNRAVRLLGSALVLAGTLVLAYVAVSYVRGVTPSTPGWSQAQQKDAQKIAAALNGKQTIAISKVQAQAGTGVAPGSEPAVRMVIPKIAVDAPIEQTPPTGGTWVVADWAIGHLTTTPNPGAVGNGAYSAHDDIKGELFKRNAELAPGDSIYLYTRHMVYRYVVTNRQVVDPSDVSVLDPTSRPVITLISCVPYWVDTQRLIVQATLKSSTVR
jgi:sortase A